MTLSFQAFNPAWSDVVLFVVRRGLRDRALIALMGYTFARVGAATGMKVEDFYVQKRRGWVQSRTASAVSDGTPFGIRIGLCLAVSIPRSTSSRSCFVTPKSQRRSSMAVPLWRTRGGRTARSLKTCCLIDRLARINRSHRTKGKRALKGARFDGLGMGWHSAKWLRG